jgi:competence protein ComEC
VPRYSDYRYGDVLQVTGELETPPQLDDFDYRGYLAHQEIYSVMVYPAIAIVERGNGARPLEWIYSVRERLSQALAAILPEPQASLAQGIILGIRGNIPQSVKDDFIRSGTAHLLAISGLHLAIVVGILLSLGIWLFGRRHYLYVWLALGGIWLYALITGMNPPVVRAAIMASLFLAAEFFGRQRSGIVALTFAAAIMVGVSPQVLQDASFQMSFAAMAGLIFIFPLLQPRGRRVVSVVLGEGGKGVSAANFVADSFSVSVAALLAVWPLVAYYFGIVSFAAPFATFCALPALLGIILIGVFAAVLGIIFLPLGYALGWLAWLFLSYLLLVADIFATIPLSFIEVSRIDGIIVWVYYLVLAGALWLTRHPRLVSAVADRAKSALERIARLISGMPRKWVILPMLVLAVLFSLAAATMPDSNLHVTFLDVGQGDAILIQRGSQQVLVDGGPSPQAVSLGLGDKMPFWDRTIELVVLTHPHDDHVSGLIEILKRYQVRQVLYPALNFESGAYDEWLELVEEKDIECVTAHTGQRLDLGGGIIIEVLNPPTPLLSGTESDIDNNGVVLRVSLGEASFLLTADIMWQAELELITQRANLVSTVLKVAHHGSDTSTTPEFLSAVSPQVAVISVGKDNEFGHPTPEVLRRLEEKLGSENIYCTEEPDEQGTIEFITDGERLWVKVD